MNSILVICTGNTCRSPMAEGILNAMISAQKIPSVSIKSGGLAALPGDPPTENAVAAMEEIGIDISTSLSKSITTLDLMAADCIYVMTEDHKNTILAALPELKTVIKILGVPDPFGKDLNAYRECRDSIITYFEKEFLGDSNDNN